MEIRLTKQEIKDAIPKIAEGYDKYTKIQSDVNKLDITKNIELQTLFNYFYRLRMRAEHRKVVYELIKRKEKDYKKVLLKLKKTTGRIEKSFASKIVATVDPNKPVIDSIVLNNINAGKVGNNIEEYVQLYSEIQKLYKNFLASDKGKLLVEEFDKYYKNNSLTAVKKLDLVLWQNRKPEKNNTKQNNKLHGLEELVQKINKFTHTQNRIDSRKLYIKRIMKKGREILKSRELQTSPDVYVSLAKQLKGCYEELQTYQSWMGNELEKFHWAIEKSKNFEDSECKDFLYEYVSKDIDTSLKNLNQTITNYDSIIEEIDKIPGLNDKEL